MTAAKCGNWDRPYDRACQVSLSRLFFVTLMSRLEIAVWTREKEREKKAYTINIELYNLRNLIDKIKIAGVLDSHPKLPAPYVSRGLFI